jgi:predicted kinase
MEALSKKLDCYNKPFEFSYFGVNDDKLTFKMDRPYKRKPILDIPTVTVLIGISGCGKDTYINYMDDKDAVVVCRDDIRADFDMCKKGEKIVGTKEQEEMVSKEFNKRLIDAAENGKNIIINNINLKKKYRDNYKELLKGYAYNWNYVYIEAPTLEENNKRHNGQVSMDVLKQMIDNFDFPMISECDNLKIIKQK